MPPADPGLAKRARAIHDSILVLDTHVDIPLNFATAAVDPLTSKEQVSLQKMESGGLNSAFFIVYAAQAKRTPENNARATRDAMVKFDAIHRMAKELYPERIEIALTADDVVRIHRRKKLVAMIGIENGYSFGDSLETLRNFYRLGARYVGLTHNGHNDLADSAQPRLDFGDAPAEHRGLSAFGRVVVAEMNRLGMMVDISHASKDAMLQMIAASKAPVIASHSGVEAVTRHPRNLDDETLQSLKRNGGVIQIIAFDSYTKAQPPERELAVRELRQKWGVQSPSYIPLLSPADRAGFDQGMADINARWQPATVSDLVDHIDHAVRTIGVEHVGISSDFGGGGGVVGWMGAEDTFHVTEELVRRGYSRRDIELLWGGNLLRVWRDVERHARNQR